MDGIVLHLGLGAFHRAHQAVYTEEANRASGQNWRIEAVSMRDGNLPDRLNAQGGTYGLIVRHAQGPELQRIGSISKAWSLRRSPQEVVARFADPAVAVATITVTEKGYTADADGCPQWSDPVVAHDLANDQPTGLLGTLVAGLRARRDAGLGGMTIVSCDNLPSNGHITAQAVRRFAAQLDAGLADWIAESCTFPSTMVDRITPAPTDETRTLASQLGGRNDPLAVETEPFSQWVIQNSFAGLRPPWERAGAKFVANVEPFERAKLHMLNGAHSLAAYAGVLFGHDAMRDVMQDAVLARVLRWHMDSVAQALEPSPELDLSSYADALLDRFRNPAIRHQCEQIADDGSQKIPKRILDPARSLLAAGRSSSSCAMTFAVWLHFLVARCTRGATKDLRDPLSEAFRIAVAETHGDTKALASRVSLLLDQPAAALWSQSTWQDSVVEIFDQIASRGLRPVLADMLARHSAC